MALISKVQIQSAIESMDCWIYSDNTIHKTIMFDTYMDGSRISHEEGFTQYIKIENNILISNVLGIKPIGGAKYKLTISPNKISTLKQGAEEHWFAFDLDRHSGKLSWMNRNNNTRLDYKAICKKFDKAKKKF